MPQLIKARFLHCENRIEIEGAGFILETVEPFHVGKIWTFNNSDKYLSALGNNNWLAFAGVPGYRIIIQYVGSLMHGRRLETASIGETKLEIESLVQDMAEFFYQERIQTHIGYYNKKYSL